MFEDKTFDNLMSRAMSYAPDWAETSEGSVFYDVAGPLCMLLAEAYIDLQLLHGQLKISTATGTLLDDKAEEYGIVREQATPWIYKLVYEGGKVNVGDRFFADGYYYVVNTIDSDGTTYIECETMGTLVPRLANGTAVVPVYTIEGLVWAHVEDIFRYATDTETDTELRERLQEALAQPSENANVAQVRKWARDFEGVKTVKVYGRATYSAETDTITENVPNNVVIFIGAENGYREDELVSNFQEYIDPNAEGYGEGVGIIGTVYNVYALVPIDISITCKVHLKSSVYGSSADTDDIKSLVADKVNAYFEEIVDSTDDEYLYIYHDNVKAKIQEVEGLVNCDDIVIGGSSKNLRLPAYKRPSTNTDIVSITVVMEDSDNDFEEL